MRCCWVQRGPVVIILTVEAVGELVHLRFPNGGCPGIQQHLNGRGGAVGDVVRIEPCWVAKARESGQRPFGAALNCKIAVLHERPASGVKLLAGEGLDIAGSRGGGASTLSHACCSALFVKEPCPARGGGPNWCAKREHGAMAKGVCLKAIACNQLTDRLHALNFLKVRDVRRVPSSTDTPLSPARV
eukprot:1184392-Prorocentrum_minimum.AAC.3